MQFKTSSENFSTEPPSNHCRQTALNGITCVAILLRRKRLETGSLHRSLAGASLELFIRIQCNAFLFIVATSSQWSSYVRFARCYRSCHQSNHIQHRGIILFRFVKQILHALQRVYFLFYKIKIFLAYKFFIKIYRKKITFFSAGGCEICAQISL